MPFSAACGIVTRSSSGEFYVTSISCPEPDYDPKSYAFTYAVEHGLRQANRRYLERIFVRKIVVYLDEDEGFFRSLKDDRSFRGEPEQKYELRHLAELVEKAGIDLLVCWAPTKAQIRPHVLAVKAVEDHLQLQNVG